MPELTPETIPTDQPVLVTGATGYVAGRLVERLLAQGVAVHASVRDPDNADLEFTDGERFTEADWNRTSSPSTRRSCLARESVPLQHRSRSTSFGTSPTAP